MENPTPESLFSAIETWDKSAITKSLKSIIGDKTLEKKANQRYGELLEFVGAKDLKGLKTVPQKLLIQKRLIFDWQTSKKTLKLLASIPVKELKFNEKEMATFPTWICYLTQLKRLTVGWIYKGNAPEEISKLINLERLEFTSNRFFSLPNSWKSLTKLEILDVSGNCLSSVPAFISKLPELKELDLGSNEFTTFPNSLLKLKQLKKLRFSGNAIGSLPSGLQKMENLETLEIEACELESLPKKWRGFTSLKKLNLQDNDLKKLPADLWNIPQLETLILSENNELNFVESEMNIKNLLDLQLDSIYHITELPNPIRQAKGLKKLTMGHHKTEELPIWILELEDLEYLNIRYSAFGRKHDCEEPIVGKNEVREFLQKALEFEKSYLSPKEVFALMESRKEENLAEALDYLSRTPDMLKQAENRYLRFIQGRLNDTNAGLERLNEVAFSLEEQELLKNSTHFSTKYISFTMADEKECRNIVDLVGAFTYHYFDKKIFWTEALAQTSLNKLKEYNSHKEFSFNSDLRCDAEIYADGWWGQAIKQFNGMTLNQIMLDHTDFELANQSPFLAEFIYFLGMKNYGLKIDIFQSSPPDLTSYFWLLPNIPTTQWGDTTPVWPTCPLNYERKAKFREGDYGNWKWKSSLEVK